MKHVKEMRCLHDGLETQVRSLSSLGLDTRNYGPMLMPVLMAKLPDELKLISLPIEATTSDTFQRGA